VDCVDVLCENFSLQYDEPVPGQRADIWCIHPNFCTKFTARNLYIRSQLGNGDGLDIDSCNDVVIEGCDISTGDDAIALKSGRGMEAERMGRPTADVTIRDCKLHSVIFAGLAIGSEISGGIRNIDLQNCTISGVQNAIYIKSRQGRGAFIENITAEDLVIESSPTFIGLNLVSSGIQATEPVPGPIYDWTAVRNLSFTNVQVKNVQTLIGTSGGKVGLPNISPAAPINNFSLTNLTGTCQHGIYLQNVANARFSGINVKGYTGNLLNLTNVTGTGLENPGAKAVPAAVK
jgi:polygalacturonase